MLFLVIGLEAMFKSLKIKVLVFTGGIVKYQAASGMCSSVWQQITLLQHI